MFSGTLSASRVGAGLRHVSLMLPVLLFVATGLWGLDFGTHWDERYFQIRPVRTMVQNGVPLPEHYGYPSFNYWVNALALLPEAVDATIRTPRPLSKTLLETIDRHSYLLRLRSIYLILTSLSIIWVYGLIWKWRRSHGEAFLASSFVASSWEVAYHARWVATDGTLMQFGALTALFCMTAQITQRPSPWLLLSAISAGLGMGAKFPGGLLIVPVLLGALLIPYRRRSSADRLFLMIKASVVFATAFLISTPAVLADTSDFLSGVMFELNHYATGHGGYTISPGLPHARRIFIYLSAVVFSPYPAVAIGVFVLAMIGCWAMIRESTRTAALFLSFPVVYLLYFSMQKVMIARNLLVVIPFFGVAAARGAAVIWARAERAPARAAFALLVVSGLALNGTWLVYSAETIAQRRTDRFIDEAAAYIRSHSHTVYFLSSRVRLQLTSHGTFANVTDDPAEADRIVFYATEAMPSWRDWPANRPWLTTSFGPREINFNMYPSWWGDDRIVVMETRDALRLDLLVLTRKAS